MIIQLLLGGAIIVGTCVVAAWSWWALEVCLEWASPWLVRPPHGPKRMVVLSVTMLWTLLIMTVSVSMWAFAFWHLQIFATLEASVYFSLVAFTTLGFGDILLPVEWRLLSGLAAANGLLVFGILTAILVETLRQARSRQLDDAA